MTFTPPQPDTMWRRKFDGVVVRVDSCTGTSAADTVTVVRQVTVGQQRTWTCRLAFFVKRYEPADEPGAVQP